MAPRLALLTVLTLLPITLLAQDTIRVCTYNATRFEGDDIDRVDEFRMVLNEIRPHILVVQEVYEWYTDKYGGVLLFRDSVARLLDIPLYSKTMWNRTTYEQVMMLIDTTRLQEVAGVQVIDQFDGNPVIRTQSVFVFRVKGTDEVFSVGAVNWESGPTGLYDRARDAFKILTSGFQQIREWTTRHILVGGLNVYSSNDTAYTTMASGYEFPFSFLYDPINRPGSWHEEQFTDIVTHSTRTGLAARFDQILVSGDVLPLVIRDSYTAFGNDGQHHKRPFNALPNTAVSDEIVQALYDASEHLPVYIDLVFGGTNEVDEWVVPEKLDLTLHVRAERVQATVAKLPSNPGSRLRFGRDATHDPSTQPKFFTDVARSQVGCLTSGTYSTMGSHDCESWMRRYGWTATRSMTSVGTRQ